MPTNPLRSKAVVAVGLSGRSVEGLDHVGLERAIMDGQWKGVMLEGGSNRHTTRFNCWRTKRS